jgi:hypothetical protein
MIHQDLYCIASNIKMPTINWPWKRAAVASWLSYPEGTEGKRNKASHKSGVPAGIQMEHLLKKALRLCQLFRLS